MKIAIVSLSDRDGGSAFAAYRLHEAFQVSGYEITMLVGQKISDTDSLKAIANNYIKTKDRG